MTPLEISIAKNKQICQSEPVEDEQICLSTIAYFDKLNMTIDEVFRCHSKNFPV